MALEGRGDLPDRQGAGRARPTPGPHLDLLAPMGHPGPTRARLPGRRHRRSTTHRSIRLDPRRIADHLDSQRIPQPLRRPAAAATARGRRHPGLVDLAAKTPSPSPRLPPPQTTSTTMNAIYGCSTRLVGTRNGGRLGKMGPGELRAGGDFVVPTRRLASSFGDLGADLAHAI